MKVVTSGSTYLDIDAYGGCIAYAELLRAQGQEAIAASNAIWNESITQTVRGWGGNLRQQYTAWPGDEFVLVDVSNPNFFDKFVSQEAVTEIIDHHPGFEAHWHERLGDNAVIEFIGAACTLVCEQYEAAGKLDAISKASARLLLTGILDNTLNFKAHVSTSRDKKAYDTLMKRAGLPDDWPAQYFTECQQAISADLATAIKNDIKRIKEIDNLPDWLGQLVIWDATILLKTNAQRIADVMRACASTGTWAMNIVSIDEDRSYFLTEDTAIQHGLVGLLNLKFEGNIAAANRLWLRKEIMNAALKQQANADL